MRPGIYVAFDRHGEHFGYARHPDFCSCTKRSREQIHKVEALEEEAKRCSGRVELLSLEEFDRLILLNIRPDHRSAADNGDIAA